MICKNCAHESYCDMAAFGGHNPPITACSKYKKRNETNYDRLVSKSPEELAFELACSGCPKEHFIKGNEFVDCPAEREPSKADCVKCWLDWLKQPVEEEVSK